MKAMTRIVYLGTPEVSLLVLKKLKQQLPPFCQLVGVVSQPPTRSTRSSKEFLSPVAQWAQEQSLPCLQPQKTHTPEFLQEFSQLRPDLCITMAYGKILSRDFLAIPQYGTINIHPSLLPRWRGAAPVQRALEAGDSITGVTLALTVFELDAGPILASYQQPITNQDSTLTLLPQLSLIGAEKLIEILPIFLAGKLTLQEQDPTQITIAHKLNRQESHFDVNQSATVLHNKVRAFNPWPLVKLKFTTVQESLIEANLLETAIESQPINHQGYNQQPGSIILNKQALYLVCGQYSLLKILKIQFAGKKPMTAQEVFNGYQNKKLTLLPS